MREALASIPSTSNRVTDLGLCGKGLTCSICTVSRWSRLSACVPSFLHRKQAPRRWLRAGWGWERQPSLSLTAGELGIHCGAAGTCKGWAAAEGRSPGGEITWAQVGREGQGGRWRGGNRRSVTVPRGGVEDRPAAGSSALLRQKCPLCLSPHRGTAVALLGQGICQPCASFPSMALPLKADGRHY